MTNDHICKNLVLLATADWDTKYKTNKQHMAHVLEQNGFKVLYVESPGIRPANVFEKRDLKRIFKRFWRALQPPSKMSERIWVCSPIQLPFLRHVKIFERLNLFLMSAQVAAHCHILSMRRHILWSYHPYWNCDGMGLMQTLKIYHCVDDLSALPNVNKKSFDEIEQRFSSKVDFVFVTNSNLKARFKNKKNLYYFSNVVDWDAFDKSRDERQPEELMNLKRPLIGFHGALSDFKIDFKLLLSIIKNHTDWTFIIIGDEREGQRNEYLEEIFVQKNLKFLGFVDSKDIPRYIQNFDVAIMPMLKNQYTENMFPMKFYEYVAARVPVVCSPIKFTESVSEYIQTAGSLEEFGDEITNAIRQPRPSVHQARACVGENTWQSRFEEMQKIFGAKK